MTSQFITTVDDWRGIPTAEAAECPQHLGSGSATGFRLPAQRPVVITSIPSLKMLTIQILAIAMMLAQGPAAAPAAPSLDYNFFKARVQPIFLQKRPGHARCVTCHQHGSPLLQPFAPGARGWNEEQSRQNFDMWKQFVVPGNPLKSPLLRHPLAEAAGGDRFHAGGKHWSSQNDPEWQTLAAWARGQAMGGAK